MCDAAQIARGEFFSEAELREKPHLRRLSHLPDPARTDPNSRPVSAEVRKLAEGPGMCAYCYEQGDGRSALGADGMHPECSEAWAAELAARKAQREAGA